MRDLLDHQTRVREGVRRIEINPGPDELRVPPPWNPAYDDLDEISLVAYAMLPYASFMPDDLPPIPPAAQLAANALATEGFDNTYQSRAFMRAMVVCDAIKLPDVLQGNMLQRMEGGYLDEIVDPGEGSHGAEWRVQPNSRAVQWATMQTAATPDPDMETTSQAWVLGEGASYPDPSGGDFNYPGDSSGLSYGATTYGQRLQTISNGNAAYIQDDEEHPCMTNQYHPQQWVMLDSPSAGVHDRQGPTSAPLCFPSPFGVTELGAWLMAMYDLDPYAGLYWPTPPRPYMGETTMTFTRAPAGTLTDYPGWSSWRARVEEFCFGTPDWVAHMLPWYRSHRPRLSAPGTPSEHWQQAAIYVPWTGKVEYRIWQRVLYLRGTLTNPYAWSHTQRILSLPPGTVPVNPGSYVLAAAIDDTTGPRPFPLFTDTANTDLVGVFRSWDTTPTPDTLRLDNIAIPIVPNPPWVP